MPPDVLGAGAAPAVTAQPLRTVLTSYPFSQGYFYSPLPHPVTACFFIPLGHLDLIILQEMRANKRKPFAMSTRVF